MNNIEEKLWDYVDGNCTADEQNAISTRIANDEAFRLKYEEILALNMEFSAMELEEPAMAFTYNVMEAIRTEEASKPLKSVINKRIILIITLFFLVTIVSLLVYTLWGINWFSAANSLGNYPAIKLPGPGNYITKPIKEGFLFLDLVLVLFLIDNYLNKRRYLKQAQ